MSRLSGKEERRASHILINAPKDMPADAREAARERAQALLEQVRKAPDTFADVAKKNSQDAGARHPTVAIWITLAGALWSTPLKTLHSP